MYLERVNCNKTPAITDASVLNAVKKQNNDLYIYKEGLLELYRIKRPSFHTTNIMCEQDFETKQ